MFLAVSSILAGKKAVLAVYWLGFPLLAFFFQNAGLSNLATLVLSGIVGNVLGFLALYFTRKDKRDARRQEDEQHITSHSDKALEIADRKEDRVLSKFERLLVEEKQMGERRLQAEQEIHNREKESLEKLLAQTQELSCAKDVQIKQQITALDAIEKFQHMIESLQK